MQNIIEALMNTLMGMGTVFIVLIFISLIISLFVYIPSLERKLKTFSFNLKGSFHKGKKEKEDQELAAAPKRPIITEDEPVVLADDNELIAVIMAAIVAAEGGAVSADSLVVRSIRRVKKNR